MLVSAHADGVIFAAQADEHCKVLDGCSITVVAMDTRVFSESVKACIYSDFYQGGRLAMEHLLECGCKNIVCIKGPQHVYSARMRYEAYRDICRERGILEQTVDCGYDFEAGLAMTEALLKTHPDVDGILACNDIVAISTYKILHQKNIPVPAQIQLTGFDDIDLSSLMSPELTTVRQPLREMAEKAMELIVRRQEGENEEKEYIFPTTLIKRETTRRSGTL
jgi:DNA-binding LacI/PurR family transcriptional regulator